MKEAKIIRVLLADGHPQMRRSLHLVLEREIDIAVVAEAGDLTLAVELVTRAKPDVIAVDLHLGPSIGHTIEPLLGARMSAGLVGATIEVLPALADRALACGALGVVQKQMADLELATAIRAASAGEVYVSPSLSGFPPLH